MSIVFFDMDKTLLDVSSGVEYVKYMWNKNAVTPREMLMVGWYSLQYQLGRMNFPRAMALMGERIKDGSASKTRELSQHFFEDVLRQHISPKALERLRQHQQRGDHVWILSASTQFPVAPVAQHIGVPYRCTELEVVDDRITGRIVGESCYGPGKLYWGKRIAEEQGATLADCIFYSDSISDAPLMQQVGTPIAINPDRRLKKMALQNSWRIEYFY